MSEEPGGSRIHAREMSKLSHELGTQLTIVLNGLALLARRLDGGPPQDPAALAANLRSINDEALAAADEARRVLRAARVPVRGFLAAQRAMPISARSGEDVPMGDVRFDAAWTEWESVSDRPEAAARFLRTAPVATLVQALASERGSYHPVSRNVVATALFNRLGSSSAGMDALSRRARAARTDSARVIREARTAQQRFAERQPDLDAEPEA